MRSSLNQMNFKARIVIGEGERDQAPMLYIGEKTKLLCWKNTGNVPNVCHGNEPYLYITGKTPINFDLIIINK